MVNTLLSCGANPNAVIEVGQSIWQEFLEQVSSGTLQLKSRRNDYIKCFEIIRSMLEHGAEIGSSRRGDSEIGGSVTIDTVIDNIFSRRIPEEADLLQSIVQQKRQFTKRKVSQAESLPSSKRRTIIKDDL
ncbi:hypothetical protein L207DRAFT_513818 [Hyaloscypha variabilis F]|uniref:Uncharacterized protein n=1 Tax=Hyaloscypha variabilis (strain UAMH 11265 / GT02V1 / F) TaxID=1149755 RepID=A0A2J6RH41_HYAVF|nr:hypothetical protein L207DRAFT_513818 [Hyaloscypha variabilis F]